MRSRSSTLRRLTRTSVSTSRRRLATQPRAAGASSGGRPPASGRRGGAGRSLSAVPRRETGAAGAGLAARVGTPSRCAVRRRVSIRRAYPGASRGCGVPSADGRPVPRSRGPGTPKPSALHEEVVMTASGQTDDVVRALRTHLTGEVVGAGDEGYDTARSVWNGMIDKRPVAVARCATTDDVAAAVGVARGGRSAHRGAGRRAQRRRPRHQRGRRGDRPVAHERGDGRRGARAA